MDFFRVYNIVQIASINCDISSISGNIPQLQRIILKPAQSTKKKIEHFRLLKLLKKGRNDLIIEQYINNSFIDHDNSLYGKYTIFVEWNYHSQQIGEYEYYYLSANVKSDVTHALKAQMSKIYLTIVKKNDSSLYVFLEYPNTCYYIVSIILEKYLKNYWKIENF